MPMVSRVLGENIGRRTRLITGLRFSDGPLRRKAFSRVAESPACGVCRAGCPISWRGFVGRFFLGRGEATVHTRGLRLGDPGWALL